MMRQYELVERVTRYKPEADENLLNKAYVYAMTKHGEQRRASGDPYFSHPLEVAAILTELKLDEETIAVALLHDTIEDTDATRKEIDQMFGSRIGILVEGLTKLKRLELVSKQAEQAENLRRLLLAVSDDIRVLLVKLADRLHNMRTLHHVKQQKRSRIAAETMEIYAPLAGRMGMHDMREELEDLSFRHLNSEAYETISQQLVQLADKNQNLIADITNSLAEKISNEGLQATVTSRQKGPYSVFNKMERKALSFEQLSDIYGFRVIVDTVAECYRALGIVHQAWSMVPGRFKDYVSTPKQNDYRSIHSTVVGPSRQRVELQFRTRQMHEIAEYGIAAHSIYKEFDLTNGSAPNSESQAYEWLRRTVALLSDGNSPEEFLEHTKLELFRDQVFCFTPKGALIALPAGATSIDFAYAVHTDVGNSCVGCKINGQIMPVISELHNGDEVEIIRSSSQAPPAAWESVVVTGKARSAIRRATRSAIHKQYSGLGTRILERAFERAGKTFRTDDLQKALPRLARDSVQDVLTAVGRGEIASPNVIRAVFPDFKDDKVTVGDAGKTLEGWFGLRGTAGLIFRSPRARRAQSRKAAKAADAIPVRGHSGDLPVRFSRIGAVPGDNIVGIIEPGEGITIYPSESPALRKFDDDRKNWLDVRWDIDEANPERFPARLRISAINEPGTLANIADIIANHDANIHNLSMVSTAPDFTEMEIDLEVWDLAHLNRITRRLRARPVVSKVERMLG